MEKEEQREEEEVIINPIQEKDEDIGSDEPEPPLPLTVTSRVLYMLGDIASYRFTEWLELVRKRSLKHRSSGFPHRPLRLDPVPSCVAGESVDDLKDPLPEISLWERLGNAATMDTESSSFSWHRLSSLHHTEHSGSTEQSEDEANKPLEVTVNSGGVVFFALFSQSGDEETSSKEAAAVIKFSSSRMATQSERLGYEFAKWLGVRTPQARVIHNSSPEWLQIKEAAEKARESAGLEGDEVGELTCSELLEALELCRCLILMSYVHGSPVLESCKAFEPRETAENTAAGLGRVLMLDLIIRNEDRLPCRVLRWRGNFANLLLTDKIMTSAHMDALDEELDDPMKRYKPRVSRVHQKERRATSVDSRLSSHNSVLVSQASNLSDITESPKSVDMNSRGRVFDGLTCSDFRIVAIDSGVPRRPPAGKRANDQAIYPKLVELLLNSPEYASNLLFDITGGKLGHPLPEDCDANDTRPEMGSVVQEFRSGFRAALRDMQGYHIFLLTLHQKLESLLRVFMNITTKISSGESDKEDLSVNESPLRAPGNAHCHSPPSKERLVNENPSDLSDSEQRSAARSSFSGSKDSPDSVSPVSRDNWHGKFSKGNGEQFRNLRLTAKLRDFYKLAKLDGESNKDLEQWTEMLKNDIVKLCQENNFNTGFFEGNDNNCVIDAYELKVRLEHILERIALISEAANTERPSAITSNLFIGGTLAARSVSTLQHLGITHILCLCSNEIGQSDSQHPDLFEYTNFSISDSEDADISSIFDEASEFIEGVERKGGKVLVHCFEGRSRSATVVIAYLIIKKRMRLVEAWNSVKKVHRRAQPNDGFAKTLVRLEKRERGGKASMEWQPRKPSMKVCPICGKRAGLSSSSLKLHLQNSHKKLSSGSVDSAMTMEIQKALAALNIARGAT